ncbi:hypothetical protein ABT369_55430 [Dactylosporangium sp. NPDC000244]|uniref:hypothetical protein n=1 Tax=Dactylosporangium sp. NPDC000244 TaxID=3154365 RepID=UPI00331B83E7
MFRPYRTLATVLAASAFLAGCSGSDEPKTAAPAAPAGAPSSAAPADSAPGATPPVDIVKGADLQAFAFAMPAPKGAQAGGSWQEPLPNQEGNEFVNYIDTSKKGYLSVKLIDCRIPVVQANRQSFGQCTRPPTGKIKGYPSATLDDDPAYPARVVVAGRVTVLVDVWVGFEQFTGKDVENFIASLDLARLAKM